MYLVLQHFESRGPKTEEHKHPSKYNFTENLLIKGCLCPSTLCPRTSSSTPCPQPLDLWPPSRRPSAPRLNTILLFNFEVVIN